MLSLYNYDPISMIHFCAIVHFGVSEPTEQDPDQERNQDIQKKQIIMTLTQDQWQVTKTTTNRLSAFWSPVQVERISHTSLILQRIIEVYGLKEAVLKKREVNENGEAAEGSAEEEQEEDSDVEMEVSCFFSSQHLSRHNFRVFWYFVIGSTKKFKHLYLSGNSSQEKKEVNCGFASSVNNGWGVTFREGATCAVDLSVFIYI